MTPAEMNQVITEIKFSPPFDIWEPKITVETQEAGFYLHISILVPDTNTGEVCRFLHSYPYFYYPDRDNFKRLLTHCMKQVVLHELGESLWIGTERPLYPHHGSAF